MGYSFQKHEPNIVEAIFTGSVGLAERLKAVDKVIELVDSHESVNLLINVKDITMTMSFKEQTYYGKNIASRKELVNARVALLHKVGNNPNRIINAAAYADGFWIVDFDKRNEALLWLQGNLK